MKKWWELIYLFRKEAMFWLIWFFMINIGIGGVHLNWQDQGMTQITTFWGWFLFWTMVFLMARFIMMINNWRSHESYEFKHWKEKYGYDQL